ncbi:hypothetical protein [Sphingomonas prati]|uniref:hypothetical protein n=1 Tax=Sphingomonas prati TaxID=1843237 RepID=UPI0016125503|nr:hypothetical protein [Sphingomonas prati]
MLYDDAGEIRQRMSGGSETIAATAEALGLHRMIVPDDGAYEQTHVVIDRMMVEKPA